MCVCVHCQSSLTLLMLRTSFSVAGPPHSPSSVAHFSLFELSGMRSHKFVVVVVRLCLHCQSVCMVMYVCARVCVSAPFLG